MNVVILLRSSGGAHFDSMAAIDGYVTAYTITHRQILLALTVAIKLAQIFDLGKNDFDLYPTTFTHYANMPPMLYHLLLTKNLLRYFNHLHTV